jgi:hypothetical protein
VSRHAGHVTSDRLGDAARHGGLDFLRDAERLHVESCERCRRLYGGYRLTDRLLAAPWREAKVPAAALARPSRRAMLGDRLGWLAGGFDARSLAPFAAVIAVLLLVGTAVALPRLIPAPAAASASPTRTPSVATGTQAWPSSSGQIVTPVAQASGSVKAPSSVEPTPAITPAPSPAELALGTSRFGGAPLAWAPDGSHLLVWSAGKVQVRDADGRFAGSASADAATWFSASTFAVAVRSSGWRDAETVKLVDLGGHVSATLPGSYDMGNYPFATLLGSGSGELTIAAQGDFGPGPSSVATGSSSPDNAANAASPLISGWRFVMWNGRLSESHAGIPIAFSPDSKKLAVLHPGSVSGGSVGGWLEILAVPSLDSIGRFQGLTLRVGSGSMGSAFGLDAAFSPDGRYLLAGGSLIDVTSGAGVAAGKGGWLPDGTLVTASPDGLLRWQNGHATLDARFPGAGTVEASRHGELIYFYGDGKPPLFLDRSGTLYALALDRVRSIGRLLIAPNGRTIALDGRATDGSSIAAVAHLVVSSSNQ